MPGDSYLNSLSLFSLSTHSSANSTEIVAMIDSLQDFAANLCTFWLNIFAAKKQPTTLNFVEQYSHSKSTKLQDVTLVALLSIFPHCFSTTSLNIRALLYLPRVFSSLFLHLSCSLSLSLCPSLCVSLHLSVSLFLCPSVSFSLHLSLLSTNYQLRNATNMLMS